MDQTCCAWILTFAYTHSHVLPIHSHKLTTHIHQSYVFTAHTCVPICSHRHTLIHVIHTHLDVPTYVYTQAYVCMHAFTHRCIHMHSQRHTWVLSVTGTNNSSPTCALTGTHTFICPQTDMHSQRIPTHFCIIKAFLYINAITHHIPTHMCTHIPQHTPLLHMNASLKALLYTHALLYISTHTPHTYALKHHTCTHKHTHLLRHILTNSVSLFVFSHAIVTTAHL